MELAVALGLTKTTIGQLVDELIQEGWVIEERSRPTGEPGRRRTPLYLDRSRRTLIGVDMNPERVIVLATSLSGEVRAQVVQPTPSGQANAVLDTLAGQIAEVHRQVDAMDSEVCGIGIGVPGVVRSDLGMLRLSERAGWRNLPVRDMLQERLCRARLPELPLLVERAVGCTALYHFEFERTGEEDPLLYIHVGWGVAVAMASRYMLMRGRNGLAGSVAHVCYDPHGPECTCGRSGCLNTMVTLRAIERQAGCDATEVRALAESGDAAVLDAMRVAGARLGVVLANLCLCHDPARLFAGGPAFQLGRVYVQAAQASLDAAFDALGRRAPRILVMRYDSHNVALGAATRVLHHLVNLED